MKTTSHCLVLKSGNAVCGLLFCKAGQEVPNFFLYFKTEFTENGSIYECK
ncbi:hypothetical protein T05_15152 [Trichinella murrelli]|uniref:Uncharacterized protein n=1 Tax=Trichinella murrelli TaxID=144512 RepID=A0A0V0SSN1_9BILA|nr:hypothetical protein T05_15152 [Trichinella murrelli]